MSIACIKSLICNLYLICLNHKAHIILLFMLLIYNSLFCHDQKTTKLEAEEFAKQARHNHLGNNSSFHISDLGSQWNFDEETVRDRVLNGNIPSNEIQNFLEDQEHCKNIEDNKNIDPDEFFIIRGDQATDRPFSEEQVLLDLEDEDLVTKKCRYSGDMYPIQYTRTLNVKVIGNVLPKKVCNGHQELIEINHIVAYLMSVITKEREKLKNDPSVKSYSVDYYKNSGIIKKWVHLDETASCNDFTLEEVVRDEKQGDVYQEWVSDSDELKELSESPYCSLVSSQCLDNDQERIINNVRVKRKCWKQRLSFLCSHETQKNPCEDIRNENCILRSRDCLERTPYGCALWENTYDCGAHISKSQGDFENSIYCLNVDCEDPSYDPNQSFPEAAAKLAIFSEMKNEIESLNADDASKLQFFKGRSKECEKSVLSDVFFDCCFGYKGLAKEVGLAKCTADEIVLADLRERGMCHYVGDYSKKTLGVKTKKVHTFCCFSSKLARVLHEEGRKQLGMGWGSPKSPNCRGLYHKEISNINLSELDLSEVYEDFLNKVPVNLDQKLESFKVKMQDLKRRMRPEEEE